MSLLAILPLVVCALVMLVAQRTALVGAGAGIATALLLIGLNDTFSLSAASVMTAGVDTLILTMSAAIVIVPGLYFNAILREHGTITAIQQWVEHLPYCREHKTLLLLFGLLPAVESLTGFGVSLFLSIPILFHLFVSPIAFRLSMVGMNIMPWGTLGLATVVGAQLSGVTPHSLGWYSALTSALVFPVLSFVALYVIGGLQAVNHHCRAALGLSAGLSAMLLLFNYVQVTEIAGVLAGSMVCLTGALVLPKERLSASGSDRSWQTLQCFLPYGGVLLIVALERLVPGLHAVLGDALVLSGSTVSLKVFTSPGIALLVVAGMLYLYRPTILPHKAVFTRVRTTCLSLLTFITLAQVMRQSNMVGEFAAGLAQWNGEILLLCSPLVGMVSGFITGSNLSGNALTMSVQSSLGAQLGLVESFTAAQNSGAGHAVFTSIPIIVMILTLAKDIAPQISNAPSTQEHHLLQFGLRVAMLILVALTGMAWIIH